MKIVIFGHSGLIGSVVDDRLKKDNFEIIRISRSNSAKIILNIDQITYRDLSNLLSELKPEYILNFAGKVRQRIKTKEDEFSAIKQNIVFPGILDRCASENDFKVISIGTDCVFSGSTGNYYEDSIHDGIDLYSQSKSMGESLSPNTMLLRSSVIGLGTDRGVSLVEWFKNLPNGSKCDGYANHLWNGVTTTAIGDIITSIIKNNDFEAGVQHLVPSNVLSKLELLNQINKKLNKKIQVTETQAQISKNMVLKTRNEKKNIRLWTQAGYETVPSINELVESMK